MKLQIFLVFALVVTLILGWSHLAIRQDTSSRHQILRVCQSNRWHIKLHKASDLCNYINVEINATDMFLVLPTSLPKDDAEWYSDLEEAYDVAFDWSVELHGEQVNIYEQHAGKLTTVTQVYA